MKTVVFKGVNIIAQDILTAMRDFDSHYADTNEYDSWLYKKNYKYAIERNGKLYPCKHILSRATGINTSEFGGGEQTNSVLRQLFFHVLEKP